MSPLTDRAVPDADHRRLAGVKSILDIPATLERLETLSVAVVGYRTSRSPPSGCPIPAATWIGGRQPGGDRRHHGGPAALGEQSALLVANPLPAGRQLDPGSSTTRSKTPCRGGRQGIAARR